MLYMLCVFTHPIFIACFIENVNETSTYGADLYHLNIDKKYFICREHENTPSRKIRSWCYWKPHAVLCYMQHICDIVSVFTEAQRLNQLQSKTTHL